MAYVRTASFVSRLPGADLLALLGPAAGERILDIGSGTGELAGRIAAAGAEVVGIDASPAMVAEARRAIPEARFFVRDAQRLWPDEGAGGAEPSATEENPRSPRAGERDDEESSPALRPASFDAVFSNAALHWMPRMADAASGIARALRPGGRVVAEMGGAGCVETIRQAVLETLRAHGGAPGVWQPWVFPDLATYAGVLSAAGLSPTLMQLFERPTPVAGVDGLRDWLQVFAPAAFERLDVSAETARAEVVERCRAKLWDGSAWVLDYVRLRFVARKP
jgi:SAM-dependent methyltransferase